MTKGALEAVIEKLKPDVERAIAKANEGRAKEPPPSAGTPSGLPRPNIIDDLPLFVACFGG